MTVARWSPGREDGTESKATAMPAGALTTLAAIPVRPTSPRFSIAMLPGVEVASTVPTLATSGSTRKPNNSNVSCAAPAAAPGCVARIS